MARINVLRVSTKAWRCFGDNVDNSRSSASCAAGRAEFERLSAALGQANRIGTRIALGALSLHQPLLDHPADDIGKCRTIDTGSVDEVGLTEALGLRDANQNSVLTWCQPLITHLGDEHIASELASAVQ